jgi:hypothetical protein
MQTDIERFLNLKHPPGRLTAEEAAWFLGFQVHEIPILIAKGLLKPLGHPASNGHKYFLTATLEELRRDEKWYNKASDAIVDHWRNKNSRQPHEFPSHGRHAGNGANATELADAEK